MLPGRRPDAGVVGLAQAVRTGPVHCLWRPEELLMSADGPELDMAPDFVRGALARGDMACGALMAIGWLVILANV